MGAGSPKRGEVWLTPFPMPSRDQAQSKLRPVLEEKTISTRRHVKLVRQGDWLAEVTVDLIEASEAWAPYLSLDDARMLDDVRLALRRGDLAAARKHARIYRLTPVPADAIQS